MKMIELSKGLVTLVDDDVYALISRFKWYVRRCGTRYYAYRQIAHKGKIRQITLHRYLVNAPNGFDVDHINGDTLDNRIINLRIATRSQNLWNSKGHSDRKNKLPKGVEFHKNRKQKYAARVMCNGKRYWLGRFDTEEQAKNAYNIKAKEMFGEYFKA